MVDRISTPGRIYQQNIVAMAKDKLNTQLTKEATTSRKSSVLDVGNPYQYLMARMDKANLSEKVKDNKNLVAQLNSQLNTGLAIKKLMDEIIPSLTSPDLQGVDETMRDSVKAQASLALDTIQGLLNTPYNGNTLFGGDKTDGLAVQNLQSLITNGSGNIDISYYLGGQAHQKANVNPALPDQTFDITSLATDPAFERSIQALTLAKNGYFDKAHEVGQVAQQNLVTYNLEIGFRIKNIESINSQLSARHDYNQNLIEQFAEIDLTGLITATEKKHKLELSEILDKNIRESYDRMLNNLFR